MERLFTPWRSAYVTGSRTEPGCVFCQALARAGEPESLVVHVARENLVVMNLFPYSSGHVMVAPRRHLARLGEATDSELAEMMGLARRLEAVMEEAYHPDGINVGLNLGRAAGAGIADHLHLHVVPRWTGDANFMTVVGGTRVIPEDPHEACKRMRELFR